MIWVTEAKGRVKKESAVNREEKTGSDLEKVREDGIKGTSGGIGLTFKEGQMLYYRRSKGDRHCEIYVFVVRVEGILFSL